MHIPDGFLSAGVAASTSGLAAAGIAVSLRAVRCDPDPMPPGILGALAAFVFAAQMINVPVSPGTSGHLVGATLVAVLVGPWQASLVMAVVLAVQALLVQDGGVTAYGANLLDMGFAGCLVGFAGAALIARWARSPRGYAVGAICGAFVATLAGAVLTAAWLALSGLYSARLILSLLLISHVPVGVLESALTGAILATVLRWRPDLVRGLDAGSRGEHPTAFALGIAGIALAVAAFVAPFASRLPDGLEWTARRLGFARRATLIWSHAPFAEHRWPFGFGLMAVGPVLAGLAGAAAVAAVAWLLTRGLSSTNDAAHR